MKYKLPVITLDMIDSWDPCQPTSSFPFVPPDWSGTALDILQCELLVPCDRIWLVCRSEVLPVEGLRQFALRCAKRVEHLDETGIAKRCNDITEQYLRGEATEAEVVAARKTAWNFVRTEAWEAEAARCAAWEAAWAATLMETRATAWAAAAASAAAEHTDAERFAQIQILKEILYETKT